MGGSKKGISYFGFVIPHPGSGALRWITTCLLCICLLSAEGNAQTFARLFRSPDALRFFDGIQTSDGGYAAAGLRDNGASQTLILVKMDCDGHTVWAKEFSPTTSVNHIRMRVIEKRDHSLVLMGNIGNTFNILVANFDLSGNLLWSNQYGGNAEDNGNGITETYDGGLAVCGYTSSFGTDAGSAYSDMYVIRLDATGNVVWTRTVGNVSAIDRAYEIIETQDSNLVFSGSYLTNATFYASLCQLDRNGNFQWLKSYGLPNHANHGYTVSEAQNGDLLLGGSTTILKTDWQSYSDNLLIRTGPNGDTAFVKVFYGTNPDNFENLSSVIEAPNGNLLLMSATASYPSTGFVPNKHVIIETNAAGAHQTSSQYNKGGSHYPKLQKSLDGGYILSGFSNWTGYGLNGNTWNALLFKTAADWDAGCKKESITSLTQEARPGIGVVTPPHTEMSGGIASAAPAPVSVSISDSTFCETIVPPPLALFSADTASACIGVSLHFTNQSTGRIGAYTWDFGDGMTNDTSMNPSHAYADTGSYLVTLTVIDTLCKDTSVFTYPIHISGGVTAAFVYTPASPVQAGQEVTLSDQSAGNIHFWQWTFDDGDSSSLQNPVKAWLEPGTYNISLFIRDSAGCFDQTLQQIVVRKDTILPNVFSPNGDGINDLMKVEGMRECEVQIFDRWGAFVFSNNQDINRLWDGRSANGSESPEGVYYYTVKGTTWLGKQVDEVHTILLMR